MTEIIGLHEGNFLIFASKHYDNVFYDTIEFQEDLKRFAYIKRLFNQYQKDGDIKERLVLNHLVIIFNMWPIGALPMLFVKLKGYEVLLKTFLTYMERMPEKIDGIGFGQKSIVNKEIPIDEYVLNILNKNV